MITCNMHIRFPIAFAGCEIEEVALAGNISSPAYGISNYPLNQVCTYRISLLGGGPVSLRFNEFYIAGDDFVQVSFALNLINMDMFWG